jgi:hypothetical protein
MFKSAFIVFLIVCTGLAFFYWNHMTETVGDPMTAYRAYEAKSREAPVKDVVHTLEAEVIRMHMSSRSHASIDVRMINTSANHLKHWTISVEAYDQKEQYLGKGETWVSHIGPGESKIGEAFFQYTQVSDIHSLVLTIGAVVGSSGMREDSKYKLDWRITPGK